MFQKYLVANHVRPRINCKKALLTIYEAKHLGAVTVDQRPFMMDSANSNMPNYISEDMCSQYNIEGWISKNFSFILQLI